MSGIAPSRKLEPDREPTERARGGDETATVSLDDGAGDRQAILSSFADVEQSLAATSRLGQQEQLQEDVQTQAREALRLAEIRYRAGADDLLTMLDAQRTLFAAQDGLAQIQLNRLQAAVSLYKALGGGWSVTDANAARAAAKTPSA
jgi:outer membrane protein TolC